MFGYYNEITRVGEIDNDDMREYAWCQLQLNDKKAPKKINPTRVFWNI